MRDIDYNKLITVEELKEMESIGLDKATFVVLRKKGYKLQRKLNEGAFGKVYAGYNTKRNCKVAVKVMDLLKVSEKFKQKFLPREIEALIGIRHDNVVYIHDIIRCSQKMYIFMEFAGGGDVAAYMKKQGPIAEPLACFWFTQISNALMYLHDSLYLAHRDIKIDNILLDDNNAKLTDFGFAKKCYDEETEEVILSYTFCGTEPYYSPQIVTQEPYNGYASDSWAMGVTLFCMLNNKFPYHFGNAKKMNAEMSDPNFIKSRYIRKFPTDLRNLQEQFFVYDEASRITMTQVLEHPWILRRGK